MVCKLHFLHALSHACSLPLHWYCQNVCPACLPYISLLALYKPDCALRNELPLNKSSLMSGFNYLQSVTPKLALGGETFFLSQAMKSGVGFAARHQGEQHVATAQIATTGLISLNYAHKLNEKVGPDALLLCYMSW